LLPPAVLIDASIRRTRDFGKATKNHPDAAGEVTSRLIFDSDGERFTEAA
jgi:hypothetical protein